MAPKRARRPREVFLSHSSADQALALAVAQTLQNHGVRVWFSRTAVRGAQQWHDEIGDALERCDWFVVLLTPKSVKSQWVKFETVTAVNDSRYANRIVPVMARKCEWKRLSWTLGTMQMVSLQPRYPDGIGQLLAVWGYAFDARKCVSPRRRQ